MSNTTLRLGLPVTKRSDRSRALDSSSDIVVESVWLNDHPIGWRLATLTHAGPWDSGWFTFLSS